jgi:hypothetical protein
MIGKAGRYAAVEREWSSLNFVTFVTQFSVLRFLTHLRFLVRGARASDVRLGLVSSEALAPVSVSALQRCASKRECAHGALAIRTSTYS